MLYDLVDYFLNDIFGDSLDFLYMTGELIDMGKTAYRKIKQRNNSSEKDRSNEHKSYPSVNEVKVRSIDVEREFLKNELMKNISEEESLRIRKRLHLLEFRD